MTNTFEAPKDQVRAPSRRRRSNARPGCWKVDRMLARIPRLRRRTEAALWFALLVVWLMALLVRQYVMGSSACATGTIRYGQAEWSWLPPGTECHYVVERAAFTERPRPWATVLPTILVCWGLALFRWRPVFEDEAVEPPEGPALVSEADVERRALLETLAALPENIHEVVDLVMTDDQAERAVQRRMGCSPAGAEYVVSLLRFLSPQRQEAVRTELADRWPDN